MATDIAFSLAIISMLGKRVPASVKIFLTALAIVDDLGAIVVIAIFYTEKLEFTYLALSGAILLLLILLNFFKVKNIFSTSFQDCFYGILCITVVSMLLLQEFIGIYHSHK